MPAAKSTLKKQQTHERILRAAARAIRKHGYEGVGVAEVMREAGLTNGGFYDQFKSRDALLADSVSEERRGLAFGVHRAMDNAGAVIGPLTAALPPERDSLLEAARELSLRAIHPNWQLATPDLLGRAHGAGLAVNVWTVNHPEQIARLVALGADGVISDFPERVPRMTAVAN